MPSSLILAAAGYTEAEIASMFVSRFAINFAVSMVVSRAFASGYDTSNNQTDNGVRQQTPPANTNSMPIVYGDAYMGGTFVDAVLTTDQKTMYYVMAISCVSPDGQFFYDQTKMYWADRLITFDGSDLTKVVSLTDGAGNVDTKISGNLYIGLYTSDDSGVITSLNGASAPHVFMGGSDIAVAQRWPSSGRQMNGLAFAIVKLLYNREASTTQMQAVTFHVSHYLNSTGVAKPGDVWYDYMTNQKYGAAMSADIVDADSAVLLNDYSDENISYKNSDGDTLYQPRYRINGVLDAGLDCLSNIDRIMTAADSWNQYNAESGKWAIVINKAETTTFDFNDTNIIGEIRLSAFDMTSSINKIEAEFPSKLNRDQRDYVYLETPSYLLYPNEPVNKYSIKFDLVNDSVQAQYLANRQLEQAREDLIVTIATPYPGIQVDAGDVVSITNAAYGWDNKLWRVMKVSEVSLDDGSLGASLELNEYNSQVFDDKDITEYTPSPNSNLTSPNYFGSLTAPSVSSSNPTATVPNFNVDCYIPATGRTTEITLFYTTVSSPSDADWLVWGSQISTNSDAFPQSSSFVFRSINLPAATYYFAYKLQNEIGSSLLSPISTPFIWTPNPTTSAVAGTFLATFSPTVMQVPRNSSLVPSFTALITQLYGSAAGGGVNFVAAQDDSDSSFVNNTWRIGSTSSSGYADIVTTGGLALGSITDGGNYAQWGIPTAMTTSPATMTVPVRYKSSLGIVSQGANAVIQFVFVDQGATGSPGASGTQNATATVYQWSTSQPADPNGSSTYTWSTGVNSAYTGTNDWQVTIPSNPGTAGLRLWQAAKQIVASAGTSITTVSWTTGFSVSAVATNGANGANGTNGANGVDGLKTAYPTVYRWAATLPAGPSGTSTYTWASNSFTPVPSGWSDTITSAPSAGYTLWAARVPISDTATALTTSINWTLASIIASGYSGTNGSNGTNGTNGINGIDGLSSRVCYTKTSLNSLASTPSTITTSGSSSFPPNDSWGTGTVWQGTPQSLAAGESLYQSDGIYNPSTNNTVWNVPYLSSLKVGSLSAITANMGTLTAGSILFATDANNYIIIDSASQNIRVYSAGVLRVKLGNLS